MQRLRDAERTNTSTIISIHENGMTGVVDRQDFRYVQPWSYRRVPHDQRIKEFSF